MTDWIGLDTGGTEQLWGENILVKGLSILKRHEPFKRNDPDSPIFNDLEEEFPGPTWRNVNRDGSFRPIFRKTHPWKKLGLTNGNAEAESVTPLGEDLLNGLTSIQEIFIEATRNFSEKDGARSFGIMCAAALENPPEEFSLEDVEFCVSEAYEPTARNLSEVLHETRSAGLVIPNDLHGRNRRRRLRDLLNALVTAGALKESPNGWTLNNPSSAIRIAHTTPHLEAPQSPEILPTEGEGVPISRPSPNVRVIVAGPRHTSGISVSPDAFHDPEKRALLLEKANSIHEDLVERVADEIRNLGGTPLEDTNSFDVAVKDIAQSILEIKSINSGNVISQVRKAVAQLPEYRWKHRDDFDEDTVLVIVTSEDPMGYLGDDYVDYLVNDRKLQLAWDQDGELRCHDGQTLSDLLTPRQ